MSVREIVAIVCGVGGILAVITALDSTEANPCKTGIWAWPEVCELKKKSAVIYDDYREQLEKVGIR